MSGLRNRTMSKDVIIVPEEQEKDGLSAYDDGIRISAHPLDSPLTLKRRLENRAR